MRWFQYTIFLALILGLAPPAGWYLAQVCERRRTFLDPLLMPVESALHRLVGVHPEREMKARIYIGSFLLFGAVSSLALFLILMVQRWLPGGPADTYLTTPMTVDLAANTAVSWPAAMGWRR